jgi:hypothetical protein
MYCIVPGLQIFLQGSQTFLFFYCSKIIQQSLNPTFVHISWDFQLNLATLRLKRNPRPKRVFSF